MWSLEFFSPPIHLILLKQRVYSKNLILNRTIELQQKINQQYVNEVVHVIMVKKYSTYLFLNHGKLVKFV